MASGAVGSPGDLAFGALERPRVSAARQRLPWLLILSLLLHVGLISALLFLRLRSHQQPEWLPPPTVDVIYDKNGGSKEAPSVPNPAAEAAEHARLSCAGTRGISSAGSTPDATSVRATAHAAYATYPPGRNPRRSPRRHRHASAAAARTRPNAAPGGPASASTTDRSDAAPTGPTGASHTAPQAAAAGCGASNAPASGPAADPAASN